MKDFDTTATTNLDAQVRDRDEDDELERAGRQGAASAVPTFVYFYTICLPGD